MTVWCCQRRPFGGAVSADRSVVVAETKCVLWVGWLKLLRQLGQLNDLHLQLSNLHLRLTNLQLQQLIFTYSLVIFTCSLVIFTYGLLIFTYSLLIFAYSLLICAYSFLMFTCSLVIFTDLTSRHHLRLNVKCSVGTLLNFGSLEVI
jgi:hypothetical protein